MKEILSNEALKTITLKDLNEYGALYNRAIEFNNIKGKVTANVFARGSRTCGYDFEQNV
jgi:hypothetical protein